LLSPATLLGRNPVNDCGDQRQAGRLGKTQAYGAHGRSSDRMGRLFAAGGGRYKPCNPSTLFAPNSDFGSVRDFGLSRPTESASETGTGHRHVANMLSALASALQHAPSTVASDSRQPSRGTRPPQRAPRLPAPPSSARLSRKRSAWRWEWWMPQTRRPARC